MWGKGRQPVFLRRDAGRPCRAGAGRRFACLAVTIGSAKAVGAVWVRTGARDRAGCVEPM